jgi:four helix bundle protein
MPTIQRFEDIEAWKTARELTKLIYRYSNEGSFTRDFGLRDQMRRAPVSVFSNIAEGFEGRTKMMFIDNLGRAKGSAGELRAQAYLALDAGCFDESRFQEITALVEKDSRQVTRFMAYLTASPERKAFREQAEEYEA